MSGLADIAVRVEDPAACSVGSVHAILSEIHALLENLLATGEDGAIDLRGLPMAEEEYWQLRAALGVGEVSVRLEALGESTVDETAHPGVWWLRHLGAQGQVLAELIHVSFCPPILVSDPADVQAGAARLAALLAADPQHSGKDQER